MKIGDKVESIKMEQDSFYKAVKGTITDIRNGFAVIDATQVIDKWSKDWANHPSSCSTSARLEDLKLIKLR
tara:strand:+ start:422 stop:634 length:213 start_codon:yes stop_codon:yes gene_type:complete